jgi:hypothetical protein
MCVMTWRALYMSPYSKECDAGWILQYGNQCQPGYGGAAEGLAGFSFFQSTRPTWNLLLILRECVRVFVLKVQGHPCSAQ